MTGATCTNCKALLEDLDVERARNAALEQKIAELESECNRLSSELLETNKLLELQQADLARYQQAYEAARPNHPERVPREQLQLAFEQVLRSFAQEPVANDTDDTHAASDDGGKQDSSKDKDKDKQGRKRHNHGRRRLLDMDNLETKEVEIIPPEVLAAGGKGFKRIGEETSSRVAFRAASYLHLLIRRIKFVRVDDDVEEDAPDHKAASGELEQQDESPIVVAPLPGGLWPNMMADASAIANVIISKYDDILPLHRQERISRRDGFVVPRSTQCGWLSRAYAVTYRIVDAMFEDAKKNAFCLATDASGAPMRAPGECESWDVFVFLADRDHVIFRYVKEHATSEKIAGLLEGFRGNLLADAAPIYDALYNDGNIVEHCCWYHCRRYFYRALETDRQRALEPLSLIAKLFEIDSECQGILDHERRTTERAEACKPILKLLDQWMDRHREEVDPRSPLSKAIGYYDNQRDALHRFVHDARISIHNNASEQQLRNLALGRDNWTFFENETGLRWYTVFRSLIASCYLHELNPQTYLEEILRLGPHWPVPRVLELAPKYWTTTRQKLDEKQRALLIPPWEIPTETGPPVAAPERAPPLASTG